MLRTHNCGQLQISDLGKEVNLCGWVRKSRDLGGMTFIDIRDRYGITQLVFNMETNPDLCEKARKIGREYVICALGIVRERSNKNPAIRTGEIEIEVNDLKVLNKSELPPFTIEKNTDGGEELRMKYRYLDLRREPVKKGLMLRYQMTREIRNYLDQQDFIEIETPVLIKSTPEGARDFVVPSRLKAGEFYALPQSPQTFKQLLMISGFDKYFQLVKCFRDEDFRADRQPEFTQVDCEMSFVELDDVLETFEGLARHLFKSVLDYEYKKVFPRLIYKEAIEKYGTDKPDTRFDMYLQDITALAQGKGFKVFDNVEYIGGICAKGAAGYSRKQLDELTNFVRKPQIGAAGLVYVKLNDDGTVKSSVDKFFNNNELKKWVEKFDGEQGDLLLILAGEKKKTLKALSELRLEMGRRMNLIDENIFAPLWVVDFPLLEWDDETGRYHAMHHPFTSAKKEDLHLRKTDPGKIRANAYDLVINGVEIGGGSIRIHDKKEQADMFKLLGFSQEEAEKQFGFLLNAFSYGAPPHGGIAFGFDRWVALFGGSESIRDYIAFPKNTAGRDIMINTPSLLSEDQLKDLSLKIVDK